MNIGTLNAACASAVQHCWQALICQSYTEVTLTSFACANPGEMCAGTCTQNIGRFAQSECHKPTHSSLPYFCCLTLISLRIRINICLYFKLLASLIKRHLSGMQGLQAQFGRAWALLHASESHRAGLPTALQHGLPHYFLASLDPLALAGVFQDRCVKLADCLLYTGCLAAHLLHICSILQVEPVTVSCINCAHGV